MIHLLRVLLALNLAGALCPVFIPSTSDYLPFGGSEAAQASLSLVMIAIWTEFRDAIGAIRWKKIGRLLAVIRDFFRGPPEPPASG
jgi:hypothetical protein